MTWVDVLTRSGGNVWVTRQRVAVRDDHGRSHGPRPLVRWHRYVRPADVPRLPEGAMLVADRITTSAMKMLTGRQWWATTADGRYWVAGMSGDAPTEADGVAHGRAPGRDVDLAALLLAAPDLPHRVYADALGVSRVRITQLFRMLRAVCPALDAADLLSYWTDADPRTVGHVTRWRGIGPAWKQAESAYRWLAEQRSTPVLGGEVAADAHVPWRTPGSAVVHVRKLTPPPPGFVVAGSPRTASVTVVVDETPAVEAVAREVNTPVGPLRLAHPLHVAQDLAEVVAGDERAAEHRTRLLHAYPVRSP